MTVPDRVGSTMVTNTSRHHPLAMREGVEHAVVSVLIVDDQELFRRAAKSVVEATEGFVVLATAASGEESIKIVRRLRPDLVLMDINLPGMDGIEAARRLTAMAYRPVVILLSAYAAADLTQLIVDSGALTYFDKSAFGPEGLAAAWASARGL
jgi:DNA-binding NarL/FixJ family response regulator